MESGALVMVWSHPLVMVWSHLLVNAMQSINHFLKTMGTICSGSHKLRRDTPSSFNLLWYMKLFQKQCPNKIFWACNIVQITETPKKYLKVKILSKKKQWYFDPLSCFFCRRALFGLSKNVSYAKFGLMTRRMEKQLARRMEKQLARRNGEWLDLRESRKGES